MKNNIFANGLLILIGILMLISAMQLFGWGKGIGSLEAEAFDPSNLAQLEVLGPDDQKVKIDNKTVVQIIDAPLFNADRKPFVGDDLLAETDEEEVPEVEADPLKAKVTSIIITGENSYAMVFDELSNASVTLKQGMPLPGDQGLWMVDAINPRAVTFVADGEEPVELSLEVFDGQLSGGKKNNSRKNQKNNRNNKQNNKNKKEPTQKNSAEEIRRKIAERRAQMRANAAKGKEE